MKKKYFYIAAILMTVFASTGTAATASFWATKTQSDFAWDPEKLNQGDTKEFEIKYGDISKWNIHSAKLWLLAVDDYTVKSGHNFVSTHCSAQGSTSVNCNDNNTSGRDAQEFARLTWIEGGKSHSYGSPVEIGNFKWYDLNINVANYLSSKDKEFEATIKAVSGDFFYKNAKIVVDYDVKAVPVPAAAWLFGSALLGLIGKKRKTIAPAVAM